MICLATRKKVYTYRGDAVLAAQTVEAVFQSTQHPYRCRSCGNYHLGHYSAVAIILRWHEIRASKAIVSIGSPRAVAS